MTYKRIAISLALVAILLIPCLAADVTGKWKASVAGRDGNMQEVTFDLRADGGKLTGTMNGPRGTVDISDGKVNGDEISFVTALSFNGNDIRLLYTGKISGDEMKMTRKREGGQQGQEFTAKRVQ